MWVGESWTEIEHICLYECFNIHKMLFYPLHHLILFFSDFHMQKKSPRIVFKHIPRPHPQKF